MSIFMSNPYMHVIPIPPFDSYITSLAPVAFYKFQDANYNTGTNLADASGNSKNLPRVGAGSVPTGTAMRLTTTKSADFTGVTSTSDYWADTGGTHLNSYAHGVAALSVTWSMQRTDLSEVFAKILGWRDGNATNVMSCFNDFGNDHLQPVVSVSDSAGVDYESTYPGVADLKAHILTVTYGSSNYRYFIDGILRTGPIAVGAVLFNASPGTIFQIAGTMAGGSSANFKCDHVSIYNKKLTDAEVILSHRAYLAEALG